MMGMRAEMDRRRFMGLAAFAAASCAFMLGGCTKRPSSAGKAIVDMGGRSVQVPEDIEKVFCSNPIGTADMYMLDESRLAGINFKPSETDAAYLRPTYTGLPSLGVWMGAGAVPNTEEVLSVAPDAVLCFWSADDAGVTMADAIAGEMDVPVVLCDCDIGNVAATFRFLGSLLGCEERAEELASYSEKRVVTIASLATDVVAPNPRTVFLSEGAGGLSTDPVGSLHVTDALELAGVGNVADMPGTQGQGMGMPTVSIEQVISWDPSAVLVSEYSMSDGTSSDLYDAIMADPSWNNVAAVKRGDVFKIPSSPFSWFGRPPSAMRLLGCLWLLDALYPGQTGIDMVSETIEFYQAFLGVSLSDAEARQLLGNA